MTKNLDNEYNLPNTKEFINKLLFAMALAVVIALAPNAIIGSVLKLFTVNKTLLTLLDSLIILQASLSFITGILAGLAFKLNPMKSVIVGAAAFISSGVVKHTDAGFMLVGIGDLLNVLIFTSLSLLVTFWLKDKLGSLTIIFQPIIAGVLVGFLGLYALPYVSGVTKAIGEIILYFTQLQPLLMSILISVSFAVLIVSPISTVAIGLIIGLTGISSGAANLGVTATGAVLIVGSVCARNRSGISIAILLAAMKLMIPNLFRNPIMYVPIVLNGVLGGIITYSFNITGTPKSAGFGLAGFVGPIEAYSQAIKASVNMPELHILIAYGVLPFGGAILLHVICSKLFKSYSSNIYHFND